MGELLRELIVDESDLSALAAAKQCPDTIVFKNTKNMDVDRQELSRAISAIPGVQQATSLVVAVSSHLTDLSTIEGLSGIVNIQVNGSRIETLDGIAKFHNARYLNVDTGRNRKRDVAGIADAPISKLSLQYAKPRDFEAIAASPTIAHLELGASPRPPLASWSQVPISVLSLSRGTFNEVGDTAAVGTVTKLVLLACRRLEALVGDNGNVKWLVIQGSERLRLDTISSFAGLESVYVAGGRGELSLSALAGMSALTEASFEKCKVEVDVENLSVMFPRLTGLHVASLGEAAALRLSRMNPGVLFSTGRAAFRNGLPAEGG